MVVPTFVRQGLAGKPITVFGDGEQTRDYVFVRDVVGANMVASDLALPSPPGGDSEAAAGLDSVAFNVGTGRGTSVNRLADILEEVSGNRPGRNHAGARPGELRHSTLDTRRLQAEGWACRWTLEDGLQETYEHIARERETAR